MRPGDDARFPHWEVGQESGRAFDNRPVGRFVVAVIVNAKSPVRAISLDDLDRVFTGKTTSWKDVAGSGAGGPIEFYRPPAASTQSICFQKKALHGRLYGDVWGARLAALRAATKADPKAPPGGEKKTDAKAAPPGTKALATPADPPQEENPKAPAAPQREKKTDRGVIRAVVKDPNAIGFVLLRCDQPLDKRVRILGIAKDKKSPPVLPTVATVADGMYPLADTITLYLHPNAPQSARDFVKFACRTGWGRNC